MTEHVDIATATERVKTARVAPYPDNAKKHPKSQVKKIVASIKKNGRKQPIVVDKDYVIIVGHGRYAAAKMMKLKEIPVIVATDLDEQTAAEYRLEDNKTNESQWIIENLVKELQKLDNPDLRSMFNDNLPDDINELWLDESKLDDAPPTPEEKDTYVKEWDVYQLGDHRIICWDSTDKYVRQELMKWVKHKADMIFTDPPYWVSYTGSSTKNAKDRDMIKNDNLRGDDLYKLLTGFLKCAAWRTREQPAVYICFATRNHVTFESAVRDSGLTMRQILIREKQMTLGRSHYHRNYEPIIYASKEKSPKRFWDRTRKTKVNTFQEPDYQKMTKDQLLAFVLEARQDTAIQKVERGNTQEYQHPTQKPVELSATFIKNSSPFKWIVLEPFSGSGSTLIACEAVGRKCMAIELDPKYVQVAIQRREELTWNKAQKIN